jgi:hypothetical protein
MLSATHYKDYLMKTLNEELSDVIVIGEIRLTEST